MGPTILPAPWLPAHGTSCPRDLAARMAATFSAPSMAAAAPKSVPHPSSTRGGGGGGGRLQPYEQFGRGRGASQSHGLHQLPMSASAYVPRDLVAEPVKTVVVGGGGGEGDGKLAGENSAEGARPTSYDAGTFPCPTPVGSYSSGGTPVATCSSATVCCARRRAFWVAGGARLESRPRGISCA